MKQGEKTAEQMSRCTSERGKDAWQRHAAKGKRKLLYGVYKILQGELVPAQA